MYIAPSSGCSLQNLNVPFKLIVWRELIVWISHPITVNDC